MCICVLCPLPFPFPTTTPITDLGPPCAVPHTTCCTLGHGPLPRSQPGSLRPPVTASSLPRRVDGLVRECSEGKHRCGGRPRTFTPRASPRPRPASNRSSVVVSCLLPLPLLSSFRPFRPSYERVDRIGQYNSERMRVITWHPTRRPAAGRHCLAPVVLGTGLHPA